MDGGKGVRLADLDSILWIITQITEHMNATLQPSNKATPTVGLSSGSGVSGAQPEHY